MPSGPSHPSREDLIKAVDLAIAGDWSGSHEIVQRDEADPVFCWVHAVLHKIEGDAANAHYWQCAPRARIISGGGFHPDSCR
jgi:hypothetical protein